MSQVANHYQDEAGKAYFDSKFDEFMSDKIGKSKAAKFNPYLLPEWSVLDFGCSSGYVTKQLIGQEKLGVEINATAAKIAHDHFGISTVTSTIKLKDGTYDAFVSHHALEHVENPFAVLAEGLRLLKPGGTAVIVVPGECGWYGRYNHWRDEINKHIFSWTPLSLGHLMHAAGFEIVEAASLPIKVHSRFLGPLNHIPGAGWLMGKLRMMLVGEAETRVIARRPI